MLYRESAKALFLGAVAALAFSGHASARQFSLSGVQVNLQEATTNVDVYFTAMRFNRAANEWDVDVTFSNKTTQAIAAPMVLLVNSFTGTSGPLRGDGASSNQVFYDFSGQVTQGVLPAGGRSTARTIALGFTAGASPKLVTQVYAVPLANSETAVGFVRSQDQVGQPLGSVGVIEMGPDGTRSNETDSAYGVATLGGDPGNYTWTFTAPGYLPVWRHQALGAKVIDRVISPRLTLRSTNAVAVSPLGNITISNASVTLQLGPGAVGSTDPVTLTPLDAQSLPAALPEGWSPLQAFWMEMGTPPTSPVAATLQLWGSLSVSDKTALARWNSQNFEWDVVQVPGAGTGTVVTVSLPLDGAYAFVVGDAPPNSPPAPQVGNALPPSTTPLPVVSTLTVTGGVNPGSSPASMDPNAVTGAGSLVLSGGGSTPTPSGLVLECDIAEQYQLTSGAGPVTPAYEQFVYAYQRPGTNGLHAAFPVRPLQLFGPLELNQALVQLSVNAPLDFGGTLITTNGGEMRDGDVTLAAGAGAVSSPQAMLVRALPATNFVALATNVSLVSAFDLSVNGLAPGDGLVLALSDAPTNALLVVARVVQEPGAYSLGLQPVARLSSDGSGRLMSLETNAVDNLPGIFSSGLYVVAQVRQPQILVKGVAQNSQGQAAGGLLVELGPWTALSHSPDGMFVLLAPVGTNSVSVTDPTTHDFGGVNVTVAAGQSEVNPNVGTVAAGPELVSTDPAAGATMVPQVSSVVMTFSRALNPNTVTTNSVVLIEGSNQPVTAGVVVSSDDITVTLLPAASLDPGTNYTVLLSTNIADGQGRLLEGENQFSFTTVPPVSRPPGAQLIIYEPGATNIPAKLLAGIPGYNAATQQNGIVVQGTPGAADPSVPVIVANESSGETATVISGPDGSFATFIHGSESDFVSATFISLNGARVYVPVSRQLFDNGFVGLYPQGGILEAQSSGGPVQVLIAPQAIQTRTKFMVQTISSNAVVNMLGGVAPDGAQIAGDSIQLQVQGSPPTDGVQVNTPVNLAALGFSGDPTNAAMAAVIPQYVGGVQAFAFGGQMTYTGATNSNSGKGGHRPQPQDNTSLDFGSHVTFGNVLSDLSPSIGGVLGPQQIINYIILPVLLGNTPIPVGGVVKQAPSIIPPTNSTLGGTIAIGLVNQGIAALKGTPLSGAFVTLRQPGIPLALPGRLNPGEVFTSSQADGTYFLIAPLGNSFYELRATHPLFADQQTSLVNPQFALGIEGFAREDFTFSTPLAFQVPPVVTVAQDPIRPTPGTPCTVQVNASQGGVAAPKIDVQILSATDLVTGSNVTSQIASPNGKAIVLNTTVAQWTGTVVATNFVKIVLQITATSGSSNGVSGKPIQYPIIFNGIQPPPPSNPIAPANTNTPDGPVVAACFPSYGGIVGEDGLIRVFFDKPIDQSAATNASGITLTSSSGLATPPPVLTLTPDQTELDIAYANLPAGNQFTLTLSGLTVRDLAGHPLDQIPSTPAADSFSTVFNTVSNVVTAIGTINNGGGAAISGDFLYTIDSTSPQGYLDAYNVSVPSQPVRVSHTPEKGMPRDLVVIPQYPHELSIHGPAVTNDMVAVVGGDLASQVDDLGNVTQSGQYLRIYEMADPTNPVPVATLALTFQVEVVNKIRWEPPNLTYLQTGADGQQIGVINLQELLIGFNATPTQASLFPPAGNPGKDVLNDGEYVAPGDSPPLPQRNPPEFYGKDASYPITGTSQYVLDFSYTAQTLGITLGTGYAIDKNNNKPTGGPLNTAYQTVTYFGQPVDPAQGTFYFPKGAYPARVTIIPQLPIQIKGQLQTPTVALVTLTPDSDGLQKVAVLDITIPTHPTPINSVIIPDSVSGGTLGSVVFTPNATGGTLQLATAKNLISLNSLMLAAPNPPASQLHPAISGVLANAGDTKFSIGTSSFGVNGVSIGGRSQVVQGPPPMNFVYFPTRTNVVDPTAVPATDAGLSQLMDGAVAVQAISPARINPVLAIGSSLQPPSPKAHYHVLVQAPGGAGKTITLGLESLNRAGIPLANRGQSFAPVRAESASTLAKIGMTPQGCDAAISPLIAYRMSDNPTSPFYNDYLSQPFALTYEKISANQLTAFQGFLNRQILWSGAYLRAFLDPCMVTNAAVGLFAAQISTNYGVVFPVAGALAQTLDGSYIMGDNPSPVKGSATLPGTQGTVTAHNGEMHVDTADMALPSPRMPILFQRSIGNQDAYDGPFGRGWDFNYNQRLTELAPGVFPQGLEMPLVVRDTQTNSEVAGTADILLFTGGSRTIHFINMGTNAPPEIAQDPLIKQLGWLTSAANYYLPERGIFDILLKFQDNTYGRLTPDGKQYLYRPDGKLQYIYDTYPVNYHQLEYDTGGLLTRITDHSVTGDRFIKIGYYRPQSQVTAGLDMPASNPLWNNRICRLLNYAGADVLFTYNDNALLTERDGPLLAGENGGYSGRLVTQYQYDGCQLTGVSLTKNGVPVYLSQNMQNTNGEPVAQSGTGMGGGTQTSVPLNNKASSVGGQQASAKEADGSTTTLGFNSQGYPTNTTVTGPNGKPASTTQLFDDSGRIVFVKYPEGNSQTFVYDTNNPVFRSRENLLSVTSDPGPRGGQAYTETFQYDSLYNMRSGVCSNADGYAITFGLTSDKRETASIQYGSAGTQTFTYYPNGQPQSKTDDRGVTTTFTFDNGSGFLTTQARGSIVYTYGYGGDYASLMGRPASWTPPAGSPTTYKYNADLQETEVARDTDVNEFAYDDRGRRYYQSETLGDGKTRVNTLTFDDHDFIKVSRTDGVEVNGSPTALTYNYTPDPVFRVATVTMPDGQVQSYSYNSQGFITNMTLGDYVEKYGLDLNGNVTSVSQGGDVVQTTKYDGFNRPIVVTRNVASGDNVQSNTYYPGGALQSTVTSDPQFGVSKNVTIDKIDAMGRQVINTVHGTTISPSITENYAPLMETSIEPRRTIQNTWDAAGTYIGYSDPILTLTMVPDAAGRLMEKDAQQDGVTYSDFYKYNGLDYVTMLRDLAGTVATYSPRADGRNTQVTDGNNQTSTMDYSVLAELNQWRRADGMERDYHHNGERKVTYTGDPGAGFNYQYDADLRNNQWTLRNGGTVMNTAFDGRNMPTSVTMPGGSITAGYDLQQRMTNETVTFQSTTLQQRVAYDALGRARISSLVENGGSLNTVSNVYDPAGPLLGTTFHEGGADFAVGYSYYSDGARNSIVYPSGPTVNEERDVDGRLIAISSGGSDIARVTKWKGAEQPATIKLGANIEVDNLFDTRGRMVASRAIQISPSNVLTHLRFIYDGANNVAVRQSVHRGGQADVYGYDAGERLAQSRVGVTPTNSIAAGPALYQRTYQYDPTGLDYLKSATVTGAVSNAPIFASQWQGQDAFLLPVTVDSFPRGDDPLGSVASARLQVRPSGAASPTAVAATLQHDGMGRLIQITRNDGTTENNEFQSDGMRITRKVVSGGTTASSTSYVYDQEGRLLEEYDRTGFSPVLRARYYYLGEDSPVAADLLVGGALKRYYYLKDNIQSVIAVVDGTGTVVERVWYDPFGQPVIEQPNSAKPVIDSVIGAADGSLLVVMSEPVFAPMADPGLAVGVVVVNASLGGALSAVDATNSNPIVGTAMVDRSVPGFAPGSVLRFTPTQPITNSISLTLAGQAVMGEWGNTNAAQTIGLAISNSVTGANVYYSAPGLPSTTPVLTARSTVGSPFLFQGQYFDYDSGLIYLRARFYDPYSGMFFEPDPLAYGDSVNLYAGFGQNPATIRDPSGRSTLDHQVLRLIGKTIKEEEDVVLKGKTTTFLFRSAERLESGAERGLDREVINTLRNNKLMRVRVFNAVQDQGLYDGFKSATAFSESHVTQLIDELESIERNRPFSSEINNVLKTLDQKAAEGIEHAGVTAELIRSRKVTLIFDRLSPGERGSFTLGRDYVFVDIKGTINPSEEKIAGTVAHEVRHWRQQFDPKVISLLGGNKLDKGKGYLAHEIDAALIQRQIDPSHLTQDIGKDVLDHQDVVDWVTREYSAKRGMTVGPFLQTQYPYQP